MVDTMIDTQLVISDERKTKKSVTLPYQLDISMYTNWDNTDGQIRICIGSLDTKLDIGAQLHTIRKFIPKELKCQMVDEVVFSCGDKELTMRNCMITEELLQYGTFYSFEADRSDCSERKLVKGV